MTHRVGPKGQVVIPKDIRDELGIAPGDEVDFVMDGQAVRVERVPSPDTLMGAFAELDLVGELRRQREQERIRGR